MQTDVWTWQKVKNQTKLYFIFFTYLVWLFRDVTLFALLSFSFLQVFRGDAHKSHHMLEDNIKLPKKEPLPSPNAKCTSITFYRLHVMQRKNLFLRCSGAACKICWDKSVQCVYKLKRNIHCAECEGCVPGIPAAAAPGWHYSFHQHLHHEKVCQWSSGYCWMKKDTGVIPTIRSSGSTPLAANFRVKALMWYRFLHCKRVCRWLTAYFRTNLCERNWHQQPNDKNCCHWLTTCYRMKALVW